MIVWEPDLLGSCAV